MINTQTMTEFPVFGDSSTRVKPGDAKYSAGFVEADVLPAEWLNWLMNKSSAAVTTINDGLYIVEAELNNLLTAAGITPDSTDAQVLQAIQYLINTKTGTIANLTTTDKTNLVAAINELVTKTGPGTVDTARLADGAVTLAKMNSAAMEANLTSGSSKLVTSGAAYSGVQSSNKGIIITTNPDDGKSFSATLTGLTVEAGTVVKVLFKQDCVTENPTLAINNVSATPICVVQNGSIVNIPIHQGYWDLDTTGTLSYKVWQANTVLELMYTGTEWLVMGNPIVCSNTSETNSYSVYANGQCKQWIQVSNSSTISPAKEWNFTLTKFISCSNICIECIFGASNGPAGMEVKFNYSTSTELSIVLGLYNRNTGTNIVKPIVNCYTMGY